VETPQFLLWAIEYACPVRGYQDGCDPERTERQLRAARAVSEARREGRVFEGFCVEPPNGFRIEDALAVYGGLNAVEQACARCPANALAPIYPDSLAGCVGIVPVSPELMADIERILTSKEIGQRYEVLFSPTQPRWYGLWVQSPLGQEHCSLVNELFEALQGQVADQQGVHEMRAGLRAALNANLPLHVELFPAGRVEGTAWRLALHCPRCKAPWGEPTTGECRVCGYEGRHAPEKKRKARGPRPYFPLDRLLGENTATEFLVRYQTQRRSQDRA
jgi:hypothetical protein